MLSGFALVVWIATQEFPGELGPAERQDVIIGAGKWRPVRTNLGTRIIHDASALARR